MSERLHYLHPGSAFGVDGLLVVELRDGEKVLEREKFPLGDLNPAHEERRKSYGHAALLKDRTSSFTDKAEKLAAMKEVHEFLKGPEWARSGGGGAGISHEVLAVAAAFAKKGWTASLVARKKGDLPAADWAALVAQPAVQRELKKLRAPAADLNLADLLP